MSDKEHKDRITIYYAVCYEIRMVWAALNNDEYRKKLNDAMAPPVNMLAIRAISTDAYLLQGVMEYYIYGRKHADGLASIEEMQEATKEALRRHRDVDHFVKVQPNEIWDDLLVRDRQERCDHIDDVISRIKDIIK